MISVSDKPHLLSVLKYGKFHANISCGIKLISIIQLFTKAACLL